MKLKKMMLITTSLCFFYGCGNNDVNGERTNKSSADVVTTDNDLKNTNWQDRLIYNNRHYIETNNIEPTVFSDDLGVGGRNIVEVDPFKITESELDGSPYYSVYFNLLDDETSAFLSHSCESFYPQISSEYTKKIIVELFQETENSGKNGCNTNSCLVAELDYKNSSEYLDLSASIFKLQNAADNEEYSYQFSIHERTVFYTEPDIVEK